MLFRTLNRAAVAGMFPVLLVTGVDAQTPSTPTVVTESNFLETIEAHHPAMTLAAAGLERAKVEALAARTLRNPTVSWIREDPSGGVQQDDWALSWQLPQPDRRALIGAREADVEGARARFESSLLSLRFEVQTVFAEWAMAAARHDALEEQVETLEALSQRERQRFESGESSGLEAKRLQLSVRELRSRAALAAAAEVEARLLAKVWKPDLLSGSEPLLPELEPSDRERAEHPLVRSARHDLSAVGFESKAASRFLASPQITLGWQRQQASSVALEGPLVGLAWSVPLFSRKQGERALAAANRRESEARLTFLELEVTSQMAALTAAFERLQRGVEEARLSSGNTTGMLTAAERSFRLGEASLTDLLETVRSVSEADASFLDLYGEALSAQRNLQRLQGTIPADWNRDLDSSQTQNGSSGSPKKTEPSKPQEPIR